MFYGTKFHLCVFLNTIQFTYNINRIISFPDEYRIRYCVSDTEIRHLSLRSRHNQQKKKLSSKAWRKKNEKQTTFFAARVRGELLKLVESTKTEITFSLEPHTRLLAHL